MKEYYIDNWNSMVIPNKIEDVEKTVSEFYKSDVEFKFAGKQRQLNVHDSTFFDRSDLNKIMFREIDFENLEYPVMDNVYAYVIPNGTKKVLFTFFENNSCVKKLYVPASVDWLWIENWYEAPSKTTDNVWVEVSPENPYFYSENGSVYKKDTKELIYLYQKPVEPSVSGRVKVKNLNGTSDNTCKCDEYEVRSWLYHWSKFNDAAVSCLPDKCPCCHKKIIDWSEELVGAHVQKENTIDNNWYIIPLCKKCNSKNSDEILEVDDIGFAWANTNETCKKFENRYQFVKEFRLIETGSKKNCEKS